MFTTPVVIKSQNSLRWQCSTSLIEIIKNENSCSSATGSWLNRETRRPVSGQSPFEKNIYNRPSSRECRPVAWGWPGWRVTRAQRCHMHMMSLVLNCDHAGVFSVLTVHWYVHAVTVREFMWLWPCGVWTCLDKLTAIVLWSDRQTQFSNNFHSENMSKFPINPLAGFFQVYIGICKKIHQGGTTGFS